MYTEEELLEAIDILVEEYGYDEEEAIDILLDESIASKVLGAAGFYAAAKGARKLGNMMRERIAAKKQEKELINKNELTEAVDILVEEYGFDEDEAIDLVNETLTLGSAARGMSNMYRDVASRRENYHNLKNNSDQHSQEVINKARNGYYKSAGKAAAATAVGALALGYAAKDAKDKFPKFKAKLDRKRRMRQRIKRAQRRMRSY